MPKCADISLILGLGADAGFNLFYKHAFNVKCCAGGASTLQHDFYLLKFPTELLV